MKVNLDIVLKDEKGEDMTDLKPMQAMSEVASDYGGNKPILITEFIRKINEKKGDPLTVGILLRRALLSHIGEKTTEREEIKADEAQRRFNISNEMMEGGEYTLEPIDRDIIKNKIVKIYDLIVIGQIMNLIEPKDKPQKEKKIEEKKPTVEKEVEQPVKPKQETNTV